MEVKRVYLDRLFDLIREQGENFEMDPQEDDVVLLHPHEIKKFSENLLNSMEELLKVELQTEEEVFEEPEEATIDLFLYDDDEDEDEEDE